MQEKEKIKRVNPENEKLKFISFRVSEKDFQKIKKQSEKQKKSVSNYCRSASLDKTIFEFSDSEKNELRSISRNLNILQIGINKGENPSDERIYSEVEKAIKFLAQLRKQF